MSAAAGQWIQILNHAGLPLQFMESRKQQCPLCREPGCYHATPMVKNTGTVHCRNCFHAGLSIRPGGGIATVAWFKAWTVPQAAEWVKQWLDATRLDDKRIDIVAATAIHNALPLHAFKQFGVTEAHRGRTKQVVARVPVFDSAGDVHSFFDIWPGAEGVLKRGKNSDGLFLPGRKPMAGETWVLVEGIRTAALLTDLKYMTVGMPTNILSKRFAKLFSDIDVILLPGLEIEDRQGSELNARILSKHASSVSIALLPTDLIVTSSKDVREFFAGPHGKKIVREAISSARTWKADTDPGHAASRPVIELTMDESSVTERVLQLIGRLGWQDGETHASESDRVFVRGGIIVHAIESDDLTTLGQLTIRELPACLIRERITQACQLVEKHTVDRRLTMSPKRPPKWLVDSIHRRGTFRGSIRPLEGIVKSPTIRRDGSILQTPGYDSITGLIFHPSKQFPTVPETPSIQEARTAIESLREVIEDFPMLDDADSTAWVAMVLTMIGRTFIAGYVPFFAVTANIRGAGKSLLVDAAMLIAYGHRAGRKTFSRNDDEMRKVITAIAISASPCVLFDNVDVQLGGASIDAAITSSVWSDRILGESRMTGDLPLRTVWTATGNNLSFGSDLSRRVLPIRLQSPLETPESRSGFHHCNLLDWIEKRRPELAVAALTILRAYHVAGCPSQPAGAWGSFEEWSTLVRGAIVWSGGADPLKTRDAALESDDTAALLRKLIIGLELADPSNRGLTMKEIERRTYGPDLDQIENEFLAEAFMEICGNSFDGSRVGRHLRSFVGRIWEGRSLQHTSAGGGVKRWYIRKEASGADGSSGFDSL